MATTLIEADEPVIESLGVDDPLTAHGGRPRRTPGPSVPSGLVPRVRPLAALPTKVRRIRAGASGMVDVARSGEEPITGVRVDGRGGPDRHRRRRSRQIAVKVA